MKDAIEENEFAAEHKAPCSPISSHIPIATGKSFGVSELTKIAAPCSPISGAAISSLTKRAIHFLWLELTSRCNLRCLHCYADALPDNNLTGRMTLKDWRGALDGAAAG